MMSIMPYQFRAETMIEEDRTNRKAVEDIKNWLTTTTLPLLPEESIILFLLSTQNDVKSAKDTIKAYFRIKKDTSELFDNRDVDNEHMKQICRVVYTSSIPFRMKNNTVVHFLKVQDPDYRKLDLSAAIKLFFMLIDISQHYDPPNELIVVADVKALSFMHLTILNIHFLKKFVDFLQEGMPMKLKSMHFLNCSYVMDKIISILKKFMNNEMINNVKCYPCGMDMDKFIQEWVPASSLPKEYGGDLPSIEELNKETIKQLRDLKGFFQAEENLRKYNKK